MLKKIDHRADTRQSTESTASDTPARGVSWFEKSDESKPFGKPRDGKMLRYPETPELRKKHFRAVLMSVILPVRSCCPDNEPAQTNAFDTGRYRGIRTVWMPAGSGATLESIPALVAHPDEAKDWLSRRIWKATGSIDRAAKPAGFPDDRPFDPPVNLHRLRASGSGTSSPEVRKWNKSMDNLCYFKRNQKIGELGDGIIYLRAVDVLRFTGTESNFSDDFIVMHLSLENPETASLIDFRQSLRTGSPCNSLKPPGRRDGRGFTPFNIEPNAEHDAGVRTLSVGELLEFHAKAALTDCFEKDETQEETEWHSPLLADADEQRLNMPRTVTSGNTSFTFSVDGGYTDTHDPDAAVVSSASKRDITNPTFDRRRIYTLTAAIPYADTGTPAGPLHHTAKSEFDDDAWTPERQWGHLLSTGATARSPHPCNTADGALTHAFDVATGWSEYATEWGYATIRTATDPSTNPDPFRLVQTRYVDLAVLALRQSYALEYLAEEADELPSSSGGDVAETHERLKEFQLVFLDFRLELWFSHIPRRPEATKILNAMQDRLGVTSQFEELQEDMNLRHDILANAAREQEQRDRDARHDEEVRQSKKVNEQRELLSVTLAVIALLVAVPAFTAVTVGPSIWALLATVLITVAIGIPIAFGIRNGSIERKIVEFLGRH